MAKIVINDDESSILKLMTSLCKGMGHETYAYQTGIEGLQGVGELKPDVLIVDLRIGDMNGLQIIEQCSNQYPSMSIIMVTGYGTVETAVAAKKLGAFDDLTKPFELEDLQRTVNRALAQEGSGATELSSSAQEELSTFRSTLIGESPEIKKIFELVEKIANNDSPALIEGEFGAGKQTVARTIHNQSRRTAAPFKVLHCSALPEDLLEMELFGGPGMQKAHTIFHRAQGGTVLLEEINVLPLRLQSQLDAYLEGINEKRLSGALPPALDSRILAASTEPLEKWVKDGRFREDLFYRISVIPINVPPLRSRRDDISLIINHFLENYTKLTQTKKKEIDKYAMELLTNYSWPGNVGELQNAIERACALSDGARIRPVDLPPKITQKIEISDDENAAIRHQLPIGTSLSDFIKKQERVFIRETLKYNEGSREKTASMLGVSIATLYRKMGLKLERDKMLGVGAK